MTTTITLVSHPGSRARRGFGPQEFPFFQPGDYTLVADIDGARYVENEGKLYRGFPVDKVMDDVEGTFSPGQTVAFDGDLPWQDGCSPNPLFFDSTHVYQQEWVRRIPLVFKKLVDRRDALVGQVMWLGEPSAAWIGRVAKTEGRHGMVDLAAPRARVAWTLFDKDVPADAPFEIFNLGRAAYWFDPGMELSARIVAAKKNLLQTIDKARSNLARAEHFASTGQLDGPYLVHGDNHDHSTRDNVDDAVRSLYVLRWLLELFEQPVGKTFGDA